MLHIIIQIGKKTKEKKNNQKLIMYILKLFYHQIFVLNTVDLYFYLK